jgi:uncharacterized repeat protein (TIGR02543 family)
MDSSKSYYLNDDVTLTSFFSTNSSNNTLNLCLNGHKLTLSDTASLIANGTINICDCQAGKATSPSHWYMYDTATSKFILYDTKPDGYDASSVAKGTFQGGVITGNHTYAALSVQRSDGTANLYSGVFAGNNNTDSGKGGVAKSFAGGNINIYDASLVGNSSTYGGAIYMDGGNLTMYGGEISNNKASQDGGAIFAPAFSENYPYTPTNINLQKGTISNNTAGNNGNGVYSKGSIKLSGKTTLGNSTSDFCLGGSEAIKVTDELTNSTPISIKTTTAPTMSNPITIADCSTVLSAAGGNPVDVTGKFVSGDSRYKIYSENKIVKLKPIYDNITYKDCGGGDFSGVHEADYQVGHVSGTATPLDSPTKEGYAFQGWFDNSSGSGTAITEIAAASSGDLTLYAKWEKTYTITIVNDGNGTASPSVTEAVSGTSITLSPSANTHYAFSNWEVITSGVTIDNNVFTMPATNVVIKANFALNHSYGPTTYVWSENNETCTASRTCSVNGELDTETVNSTKIVTQAQSCETKEISTFVASFSNSAFAKQTKTNIETKDVAGHSYEPWVDEVPATCTSAGVKAHKTCSVCHKNFDASGVEIIDLTIAVLDHAWGAPTYTWNASGDKCTAKRVCSNSDATEESEVSTGTKIITQVKGCENDELSTYTCYFTNSAFTMQTNAGVVTATRTGHNWSTAISYVWDEDKCTASRVCLNDSSHIDKETVIASKVVTQNKDCTLEEKSTYTATFTNSAFATQTKTNVVTSSANGHYYGTWIDEVLPTCEHTGTKGHYHCPVCNKNFDNSHNEITDLSIAKVDHTYGGWIEEVPATCETAGVKGHYHCSVCGKNFDTSHQVMTSLTIEALGHSYGTVSYVWNGNQCTASRTCSTDLTHVEKETVTATIIVTQKSSCDNEEISTYVASFTNVAFEKQTKENVITAAKLEHNYGSWIEEVPATAENAGVKGHYHCSLCGKNFDASHGEITNLAISPITLVYENPTYVWNEAGDKCTATRVCTTDATYTQTETITAKKVVTQTSDCEQEEKSTYIAIFTNSFFVTQTNENVVTATKNGHSYGSWIEEVAATCEHTGTKGHYHCSVCGKDFDANHVEITDLTIAIAEHSYGSWIEEVPATTTTTGVKGHYHCSVCGKDFDINHNEITDLVMPKLAVVEEARQNDNGTTAAIAATSSLASLFTVELGFGAFKFWKIRKGKKTNKTKTYSFAPLLLAGAIPAGYIATITVLAILVVAGALTLLYFFVPEIKEKTDKQIKKWKDSLSAKKAKRAEAKKAVKDAAQVKAPSNEIVEPLIKEETITEAPTAITKELPTGFNIQYIRSFLAKLIQSSPETKAYYKSLKLAILSYEKISDRTSWSYETLNHGRVKAFKFSIRGKTLCLSLALDPHQFENSKFKVENDKLSKYVETPCLYRIKNERRAKYAIELIDTLANKLGFAKSKKAPLLLEDIPNETTEALLARGLIKEIKEPAPVKEVASSNETKPTTGLDIDARYKRSFLAKLIQSSDEVKSRYWNLKNAILSYKKVSDRISWSYETLNNGRNKLFKFAIKGKTLCLFLALNPDEYKDSKYLLEKEESKKYLDTPSLYRIKNPLRMRYALELIDIVSSKFALVKAKETTNYEHPLPYETTEALLTRGLIKELEVKPIKKEEEPPHVEETKPQIWEQPQEEINPSGFGVNAKYKKSFMAKLIISSDETKSYYKSIKMAALSYKEVNSRISWNYEAFNKGRNKLLKLVIKGKTLYLYLALNPNEYKDSKYHVEEAIGKKYRETPCLYKIKNPRRAKYALELIDFLVAKFALSKRKKETPELAPIPSLSMDELIAQGLVIDLEKTINSKNIPYLLRLL